MTIANNVLHLICDTRIKNFHISLSDAIFGKFDDVVFEIESDPEVQVKAMQLKHNDNKKLSNESLKSRKGDFSISKYFESFQNIRNVADELILATNRPFKDNSEFQLEGEEFYIKPIELSHPTGSFPVSYNRNNICKFQIVEGKGTTENLSRIEEYRNFFNIFYLYSDQGKFRELRQTTIDKFKTTYSSNEQAFDGFFKIISEWSIQNGRVDKLNKKWMQRAIALQLLSPCIETLIFGPVSDKMAILRDVTSNFDITRLDNNCEEVKHLWGDFGKDNIDFNEINRVRNKYQLCTDDIKDTNLDTMDPEVLTKLLWLMKKSPLIISGCGNVEKAIQLCPDQKFILLGESKKEWMQEYSVFENLSNLRVNPEMCEKVLQNFTISIQGKEKLNLLTAFGSNEEFLETVTTDNLMEMLNRPYNLGGEQELLPAPYIERCLYSNVIGITYFEKVHENTITILNCANNFDKVRDKLNNCTFIDISDKESLGDSHNSNFEKSKFVNIIYTSNSSFDDLKLEKIYQGNPKIKRFHYLRVLDDGNLQWIRSKGDVSDLESYQSRNHLTRETELWPFQLENKIHVITGDPGMGKSELAKSFKNKSPPKQWTIIIYPKDVESFFKMSESSGITNYIHFQEYIVNEKYKSFKDLERNFFQMCLKEKTVVYIWDALDEIFNNDLDSVASIILQLAEKGFVQWVTCRQHMKTSVEKKFTVLSRNITPFSQPEQQKYIEERLGSLTSTAEIEAVIDRIKSTFVLVDHVDILGIPLQIYMLTHLLWRKGKYLDLLRNKFLLTDLFEYFLEKKFNIYYTDKCSFDLQNRYLATRINKEKITTLESYIRLAFTVIFPKEVLQQFNIVAQHDLHEVDEAAGMITERQNNMTRFFHISFAEYLLGLHFSKHPEKVPKDIFFEPRYDGVRFFFDMLLAKNSPAHIAVLYKNFDLLKTYDDKILTSKDEDKRSVLHLMCSWGKRHPRVKISRGNEGYIVEENSTFDGKPETKKYLETVMYLQSKCDPSELVEPLSYARKSDSLAAELKLLQCTQSELNPPYTCNDVVSILYYSALLGYGDDLNELFTSQKLQTLHEEIKFVTLTDKKSPLVLACHGNHTKTVECLLKLHPEINRADSDDWTPLHHACSNGNEAIAELLMDASAHINCVTNDSRTPLYMTCQSGAEKTVERLLNLGAKINDASNGGFTPLYVACFDGHKKTVDVLLKFTADTNRATDEGYTPLYVAAEHGHLEVVKSLVESGVAINQAQKDGVTPIFPAICNGHDEIVTYLVGKGAWVNHCATKDRWTPLLAASEIGDENVVKLLLNFGAKVNQAHAGYVTPLLMAARNGHVKTVEILRRYGADINYSVPDGSTALDVASQKGHEKVVEILKSGS